MQFSARHLSRRRLGSLLLLSSNRRISLNESDSPRSSGLYVAAGLMRRETDMSGSGWIVLLMMLYGAFSFYVGIDLPGRSARRATSIQTEAWSPGAEAVEILSATGIFLVAIATFVSVS